jgi:hypothetical protein
MNGASTNFLLCRYCAVKASIALSEWRTISRRFRKVEVQGHFESAYILYCVEISRRAGATQCQQKLFKHQLKATHTFKRKLGRVDERSGDTNVALVNYVEFS